MIHARLPAFNGEILRDRNYVTACGEPAASSLVVSDPVVFLAHRWVPEGLTYCRDCATVLRMLHKLLPAARDMAHGRIPAPLK